VKLSNVRDSYGSLGYKTTKVGYWSLSTNAQAFLTVTLDFMTVAKLPSVAKFSVKIPLVKHSSCSQVQAPSQVLLAPP